MEELKCKICGKPASEDKRFVISKMLCRRHNEQMLKHGHITDPRPYYKLQRKCDICGAIDSPCYYTWNKDDEYNGKILCNRHYLQLRNHGKLLDNEYVPCDTRKEWTSEEILLLEELYKDGKKFEEISKILNKSINSINSKSFELKLGDKYMRSNNPKFKAVYQDYDWCYERYINRSMTHQEMANECGASLRVIQKWCVEVHGLHQETFRKYKKLNERQYELIMFGTLGDGHIDNRETQPMYIESHAENDKDYMFWKYEILKDLCNNEPKYYPAAYTSFGTDKQYLCQPFYRINTRILDDLYEIRNMSRIEKINRLNEFGLSVHILDDGNRDSLWHICLAEYTQEEIDLYLRICEDRFGISGKQGKDLRYVFFDAPSSRRIDQIILSVIPENLDIIQRKIINNSLIPKSAANYIYIICKDRKIGLNTYCRANGYIYLKAKSMLDEINISEILEDDFKNLYVNTYKI